MNKEKKNKWNFKFKKIIIRNLPTNPSNGGIPNKDSRVKIIDIEKKFKLLKNFIEVKTKKEFKLKKKKTLKIKSNPER